MKTERFEVGSGEAGTTLLDFAAARRGCSRNAAKRLLDARVVFVNRRRTWMARHVLRAGDTVEIAAETGAPARGAPLVVLLAEGPYIVVDKPPGVVAVGPASVEERLRAQRDDPRVTALHRLDKDTSGCMLFATRPRVRDAMIGLFRQRQVSKIYHAVCAGRVGGDRRTLRGRLDGKSAITHLEVLSANRAASHLAVRIETGRTHQIRKHLSALGHPVLGDPAYGTRAAQTDRGMRVPRQMLHAASIRFRCPQTGQAIVAKAPLPGDFRACLRAFELG